MQFTVIEEIPYPPEEVFEVLLEHLPELAARYLPNVDAVDRTSRRFEGPVVHQTNRWQGHADLPRVLRGFITPEWFVWTDTAAWNRETLRCQWSTVINLVPNAVSAKGTTTLKEEDGDTIVQIVGEFTVHADRLPAMPGFVSRSLAPAIERLVIGKLKPNMRTQMEAIERYIEDEG